MTDVLAKSAIDGGGAPSLAGRCHVAFRSCCVTPRYEHTAAMFEPIRGGTRGGQAEFKWSDVSADKDREVCDYLRTQHQTHLT